MDDGLDCHSVDCVHGVLACLICFVLLLLWSAAVSGRGICFYHVLYFSDVLAGLGLLFSFGEI